MKRCEDCGKELQGGEARFSKCRECYFKDKNTSGGVHEPPKIREKEKRDTTGNGDAFTIDTNKNITIPWWFVIAIFLVGVFIGAILW